MQQTSIGTGYDLSNSVFSPDGRNFQVEYAVKAVENGGTCIGIRTKHGVVLAVEKIITSKLLKPNANKRIATVDRNVGIVTSGLLPDGRHLISRARDEASSWRRTYKAPISMSALASRLGGYVQAYTLYSSVRPFGISAIVGGWDSEAEMPVDGQVGEGPTGGAGGKASFKDQNVRRGGPGLYMIEPSGLYWVSYIGHESGQLSYADPRHRATTVQQQAKVDSPRKQNLRNLTSPPRHVLSPSKKPLWRLHASSTSPMKIPRTKTLSWR